MNEVTFQSAEPYFCLLFRLTGPYLCWACFWQLARLIFAFFLQAFRAAASFCAFVSTFGVPVFAWLPLGNAIAGVAISGGGVRGVSRAGKPGVVNVPGSPWLEPSALLAVTL